MKIYTVYEDGVGYGVIGIASYYSEKEAKDHASRSSYYYILDTAICDKPASIKKKNDKQVAPCDCGSTEVFNYSTNRKRKYCMRCGKERTGEIDNGLYN